MNVSKTIKNQINDKGELKLDSVQTMALIAYLSRVEDHMTEFAKIAFNIEQIIQDMGYQGETK